ncbi:MAG: hypothetical protein JXR56_05780 [Candidatus Cloacimonetes bacterium]|nr:hypothetical protein [Candidatus Cloacimonadota bacterium]
MVYKIMVIKIDQRSKYAIEAQKILTEFGCYIQVRLGLHEATNEVCSTDGLIILEVRGDSSTLTKMLDKLNALEHVTAKIMEI